MRKIKIKLQPTENERLHKDLMDIRYAVLDQKPLGVIVRDLEIVIGRLQHKIAKKKGAKP